MSMEIGGINNINIEDYRFRTEREKAQETENADNPAPAKDMIRESKDEYISSEKKDNAPTGLYRLGQDENGKPKVIFDDPEKAKETDKENPPKINSEKPESKAEKCTTNTDKVDREIKNLKEEKKQLEQQLQTAAGDDKKTEELTKEIAAIEKELSQKDNDTYRRQHAVIS